MMQEVPVPVKFFVTRWAKDPWAQMAYSYVKTGGSGEAYDIIAEDIQGKIFFAGEVRPKTFFFYKYPWLLDLRFITGLKHCAIDPY